MLVAISTHVPTDDLVVCQRACDVLDRVVRAQEVSALTSRQLDTIIPFLLKCSGGGVGAAPGAGVGGAGGEDASAALGRAVAASALRALGCLLYENYDRATKWHDPVVQKLLPFIHTSALPSPQPQPASSGAKGAGGVSATAAAAAAAATAAAVSVAAGAAGGVAAANAAAAANPSPAPSGPPPPLPLPVVPLSEDTVHAALVCLGNLVLRAGPKVRHVHANLYAHLLRVLGWGVLLPARTLPEVEAAGRVLSSALRALLPILQAGEAAVKDAYGRTSEDLLRILRDLSTFGWACEALMKKRGKGGRRAAGASPAVAGAAAGGDATSLAATSPAAAAAAAPTTPSRRSPSAAGGLRSPDRGDPRSDLSGTDGEGGAAGGGGGAAGGDRGSVQSRSSASTRSRWQMPGHHHGHVHGSGGGSVSGGTASAAGGGSGQKGLPGPGGSVSRPGGGGGGGASSWYTNSDSEEEDGEGGGASESGAGFSLAAGAAKHKRLIPIRVRATALQCLQALAKHFAKVVQSRWELFIPQVQGVHPRPYATSLLTVVLFDPSHRVQETAAAALAAIVQDAPLHRWIALPVVHNAASAVHAQRSRGGATGSPTGGRAGVGVAVAAAAAGATGTSTSSTASASATPAPAPSSSSSSSSSTYLRRAFNSLSDKTSAMVSETHKGVSLALSRVDAVRYPGLAASLLRCAGYLMAVTPYDRLEPGMAHDLCGLAVGLLEAPAQAVAVAALQCIAAIFSNTAAVADIATAGGTEGGEDAAATATAAAATATASATNIPPRSRAHQLLAALIAHTGKASGVSPVVRAELLSVLGKAARHHPSLLVGCWASLQSLLLDAFGDAAPPVRAAALRVVEEILHARAAALSAKSSTGGIGGGAGAGGDDGDDNADEEGAADGTAAGLELAAAAAAAAEIWAVLDGRTAAGAAGGEDGGSGGSAATAAGAPAPSAAGPSSSSSSAPGITIRSLLLVYLRAAIRDVSPAVRAEAAMCMSYLLPVDWASALCLPCGEAGEAADTASTALGGGRSTPPVSAVVAAAAAPASTPSPGVRNELLALLASASFDTAPPVRVAAARMWGAYLAYPEWKTSTFAQLAGRILLCLIIDDNLSVRAKASWALGNLCAPLSTSPAHAAAFAAAVTKRMRGGALAQPEPIIGSAAPPAFTLYPYVGELAAAAAAVAEGGAAKAGGDDWVEVGGRGSGGGGSGASSAAAAAAPAAYPPWIPSQCRSLDAHLEAAGEVGGTSPPLAPLELYEPGVSQAALVNILGLPFLRVVTQRVLASAGDHDKVSCTGVRTLGYCVQALLYHWLPLPDDVREFINPVVLASAAGEGGGKGGSSAAKRAEIGPCPDDALIKSAMLALSDIVAGTAAGGAGGAGNTAAGSAAASAAAPGVAALAGEDGGAASSGVQKTLPSQSWVEVGDEEDVREIISKRLQGPSMRKLKHPPVDAAEGGDEGGGDGWTSVGGGAAAAAAAAAGMGTAQPASPPPAPQPSGKGKGGSTPVAAAVVASAASPPPAGASPSGAAAPTSRFRFNTKAGRTADASANWREKPPSGAKGKGPADGVDGSATGAPAAPSPGAPSAAAGTARTSPQAGEGAAGGAAAATTPGGGRGAGGRQSGGSGSGGGGPSSSSAAAGTAMKVRWNACHAVTQIIPLTHRLVNTHPTSTSGAGEGGEEGAAAAASSSSSASAAPGTALSSLPASTSAITSATTTSSTSSSADLVSFLSQPSPPRPRVRKDVGTGASLMWAGVDHISTANSPFMPKDLVVASTASGAAAAGGKGAAGTVVSPTAAAAAPASSSSRRPSGTAAMEPPAGTTTPQRPGKVATEASEAAAPAQSSSSSSVHTSVASASSLAVVTDPTHPTVSIGTTWVPPTLAALHLALTRCANFKVRIAAAQALGAVPSRMSYRIPAPGGGGGGGGTGSATGGAASSSAAAAVASASGAALLSPSSDGPVAAAALAAAAASVAPVSHLAPALQRPGYDAYPPALAGLLGALEASEQASDYTEFRYKDQLKGVIRVSLARTILLAERMDYGRMKPFFDAKAELLYVWLCAEEALAAPRGDVPGLGGDGMMMAMMGVGMGTTAGSAAAAAAASAAGTAGGAPAAAVVSLDDMPLRSAPPPPFGVLQPHPSIDAAAVHTCFQRLTALFASRVKTLPPDLLRKFQAKAGQALERERERERGERRG
jgi:hypothetical protein